MARVGTKDWAFVSDFFPGRDQGVVAARWRNVLRPELQVASTGRRRTFTPEDDLRIMLSVKAYRPNLAAPVPPEDEDAEDPKRERAWKKVPCP